MSFSFRNIFSPDDPEYKEPEAGAVPNGFSVSGGVPWGRGNLAPESGAIGPSQTFLASELLPYIPKAIAALSGIPMAKEIHVPLPSDGSLDVPLSTLYHLCPELFAAEITPLNDSVVTLPPRLGSTPATAVPPSSVFAKSAVSSLSAPLENASANPFWSPVTPVAGAAPASSAPKELTTAAAKSAEAKPSWPQGGPGQGNPFSAEISPPQEAPVLPESTQSGNNEFVAGGFDAPSSQSKPAPLFGVGEGAASLNDSPASGFFGFSEVPSLKNEETDPDPRSKSNPFESEQGFATLFSKQAQADAAIPFPDKSSFSIPLVKAEEPEGVWGAMFSGAAFGEDESEEPGSAGFAPAPFESIGNLLKQGNSPALPTPDSDTDAKTESRAHTPAPVDEMPPSIFGGFGAPASPPPFTAPASPPPFGGPFASPMPAAPDSNGAFAAGFTAFAPASAEEPRKDFVLPEAAPEPQAFFEPFPEPVAETPPPAPAAPMTPALAFDPPTLPEPPAAPTALTPEADFGFTLPAGFGPTPEEMEAPADPAPAPENRAPEIAPEPVVEPVVEIVQPIRSVEPAPAAPASNAPADPGDDGLRDLELRAIFSTSESFNFSKVARKIVGLPGINSCSLSAPGKVVQASRREENRLGSEAREMVATLRSLAKLTGLPEARTFTLQTDRGIVSLFLEGECCVTVHHDSSSFQPGVREKLILIARSLVKLRE